MIVGKRQRQHQARHEGAILEHGLHARARDAENGDLGCVDNGGKERAADAAQARHRETPALHVTGQELVRARLVADRGQLRRQVVDALAVHVADDGHHQSLRRVDGHAEVVVALEDQVLARGIQRGIEGRESLQRHNHGLHDEGQHGQLQVALLGLDGFRLAKVLQVGDVGLVVLGDMHHAQPGAMQMGRAHALDA